MRWTKVTAAMAISLFKYTKNSSRVSHPKNKNKTKTKLLHKHCG
jgi:hypothetical protein